MRMGCIKWDTKGDLGLGETGLLQRAPEPRHGRVGHARRGCVQVHHRADGPTIVVPSEGGQRGRLRTEGRGQGALCI